MLRVFRTHLQCNRLLSLGRALVCNEGKHDSKAGRTLQEPTPARTMPALPNLPSHSMTILLSTLNARYAHASLGLRYLLANMGPLQERTALMEFVIGAKTTEVVERLLAKQPREAST